MTTAYFEAAKDAAGSELAEELAADLRACEAFMRSRLGSQVESVESVGRHVAEGGGKRLRPLFVSLGARAGGGEYVAGRVHAVGACVEMIHMATLIHDDVVDEAPTRRGRPAPSALWGNTAAILSGDVLLSKAMEILAEDGDLRIIRTVSRAVVEMAEGQVLEVETRGRFDLSADEHMDILRRKTASFMACCCKAGAMIGGADPETERALDAYGRAAGVAFQIADDLLDFRGEVVKTGKRRATDFCEGVATLPLIYLRDRLDADELDYTRSRFGNGITEKEMDVICGWMEERGAYGAAMKKARAYAAEARAAASSLPPGGARRLLEAITNFVVAREA